MPDPSFILPLVIQSALIPFGVALAALIAFRAARFSEGAAVAIALGFVAAYFAVFHQQWSFVPHQALDWLPWIALLTTVGAIAVEHAGGTVPRIVARSALALAIAALAIWPAFASLGLLKTLLSIAVTGALTAFAWSMLAPTAANRQTPALLLTMVAGGAALALMLDSSQAIGQSSGALASALIACIVFNLPRVRMQFSGAATGIALLLLAALLANAHFYAGFSLGYVALLAGALLADPLVAALTRSRQKNGGFGVAAGTVLLGAVPVVAVLALVAKTAQESGGY
jgi:hypothetical protein